MIADVPCKTSVLPAALAVRVPLFVIAFTARVLAFKLKLPAVIVSEFIVAVEVWVGLILVALFVPDGLLIITVPKVTPEARDKEKPPLVAFPADELIPSPKLIVDPAKFFAPVAPATSNSVLAADALAEFGSIIVKVPPVNETTLPVAILNTSPAAAEFTS